MTNRFGAAVAAIIGGLIVLLGACHPVEREYAHEAPGALTLPPPMTYVADDAPQIEPEPPPEPCACELPLCGDTPLFTNGDGCRPTIGASTTKDVRVVTGQGHAFSVEIGDETPLRVTDEGATFTGDVKANSYSSGPALYMNPQAPPILDGCQDTCVIDPGGAVQDKKMPPAFMYSGRTLTFKILDSIGPDGGVSIHAFPNESIDSEPVFQIVGNRSAAVIKSTGSEWIVLDHYVAPQQP